MSLTVNLRKKLHRKVWEQVFTPLPVTTAAGVCFVKDKLNLGDGNLCYFLTALTTGYLYTANEEGFGTFLNSGATGTFGAGVCAYVHPMGATGTANSGTTLSINTSLNIVRDLRGYRIRITSGTNAGQERIIAYNTLNSASTIYVQDAFPNPIDSTSTFVLLTTRLWYSVQGTSFQYYDFATNAWTSRAVTLVPPAITSNEAIMLGTPGVESLTDTGNVSATVSASTSVPCGTRTWTTNIWVNSLFKVISGTGVGTYRVVLSNTGNTLTLDAAVTLDTTSVFELSGFSAGLGTAGSTALQIVNGLPTALTVTSTSSGSVINCANTAAASVGMVVSGTGIPAGSFITSIVANTSITISGTISTATGTTVYLGNSAWGQNIWVGNQVRIVAGTGAGQVRTIASNNANTLFTVMPWQTTPDATSYFVIEGNDDQLWVTGGAVTTVYKYSIGGTCAAMSPITVTSTSSGSVINCANTANALVGQYVIAPGVPAGSTITAITTNTSITISGTITSATGTTIQVVAAAHSPANLTVSSVASGNTVIGCAATGAAAVGMYVAGTGIPSGAIITAISNNVSITISAATTATTGTTVSIWNNATSAITITSTSTGSTINCSNTTGVAVGQLVAAPGVPVGSRVVSFVANTSITISGTITSATGTTLWVWSTGLTNNWITVTPTTARGGAAAGGMCTAYLAQVNDLSWTRQVGPLGTPAQSSRQNGRYLYSWRGSTSALDVYDMALNSWQSNYLVGGANLEQVTAGGSCFELDGYIYMMQGATGKLLRYDAIKNEILPIGTNANLQGAAVNGNRLYVDKYFDKTNGQSIRIIYWAGNTSTNLYRMVEI